MSKTGDGQVLIEDAAGVRLRLHEAQLRCEAQGLKAHTKRIAAAVILDFDADRAPELLRRAQGGS